MEWPSYGWLLKRTGMASGIPDTTHVPCAGSAPWHMGALHKTYRDCAPPDWGASGVEVEAGSTDRAAAVAAAPSGAGEGLRRVTPTLFFGINELLHFFE